MKITIPKDVLKEAADQAAPFVARKNALDTLRHLHISAAPGPDNDPERDELTITASDMQCQLRIRVPLPNGVAEMGHCLFPATQLQKALAAGRGGELTLETKRLAGDEGAGTLTASIQLENGSIEIEPPDAAQYPDIFRHVATDMECAHFIMPKRLLAALAETCAPFCATDEMKPVLQGVLIQYDPAGFAVVLAATDGHRLVELRSVADLGERAFRAVLPGAFLQRAAKAFAGDVDVTLTADWCVMRNEFVELQFALLTDPYLDYAKAIPAATAATLEVDRDQMKRALDFIMIWARDERATFALSLNERTGATLQLENYDAGTFSREVVYHSAYEGAEMAVGFSGKLFRAVLDAHTDRTVRISFVNEAKASVWHTVIDGMEALFLLMPIRLQAVVATVPKEQHVVETPAPNETAPDCVSEQAPETAPEEAIPEEGGTPIPY